jgi:hypothetical protein
MSIKRDWASKDKLASADLSVNFQHIVSDIAGQELFQYNETPTWHSPTPGQFDTIFPYKPGTLQVFMGRHRMIKDVDYQETSIPSASQPTQFNFLQGDGLTATDPNPGDDTKKIRVDYMRSDL